ncbi:DNA-directed RNA polymerase subunit omega [Candidatus Hydrogenisulfobacillus filiaventi]|uniref:DNA-directed RNA polymerase subunit omega n=1 Tax=Candidatus Hydrogenisulfobacillus filiaventi TaxID=2707344 RepID=A0A6F8ZF19_9FIRM|nr:DNA-directed RNA polymerase subunit omega [Bacillota bacterium]CAB1128531.1 DNA-directed RNA polymerase subunit omega [Candidatus Hydrogenisulfobacillus filiaventi]
MRNTKPFRELVSQSPSKYALVVAAAKRGRAIMDGAPPLVETRASKPVTIALDEIARHGLIIEVPPAGNK